MKLKEFSQGSRLSNPPSRRSRSRNRASWIERRHKKAVRGPSASLFTWRY